MRAKRAQYPLALSPSPETFRIGGKGEDTAAEGESDEKKHANKSQERQRLTALRRRR